MICLLYYNMHQLSNKNNNYLYLNNSKNINYLHLYNDKNTNYLHLNNSKNTNNMHVKLELSYKLSEKPLQFPPQFPIIKSNKKNQKRNIMKKEYRELKDLLDYINASREEKDEIKGKINAVLYNQLDRDFPYLERKMYTGWQYGGEYLSAGMKYRDVEAEGKAEQEKYFGEAASIFVYAEKEGPVEATKQPEGVAAPENPAENACLIVSLSASPDKMKEEAARQKFYRFFDLELDPEGKLQYVLKYNAGHINFVNKIYHNSNIPDVIDKETAFARLEAEKNNSTPDAENLDEPNCIVELCYIIHDPKRSKTEDQLRQEFKKAVELLMPYYKYVLEIPDSNCPKLRNPQITTATEEKTPFLQSEEEGKTSVSDSTDELRDSKEKPEQPAPNFDHNLILYGPPGTGKTYKTAIYAVTICDGEEATAALLKAGYSHIMERYTELKKQGRIGFTTFHQSYGYEDFVDAIRPVLDGASAQIGYEKKPGIFREFCENARSKKKPCVFIIDEINRGNIAKIFGELITLIEESKRDVASVILPNSRVEFSVPSNVYIIGTMNTADRSIAMMDTALRRRFRFEEIQPSTQALREMKADKVFGDPDENGNQVTIDVAAMLDVINRRIEVLHDREHTIGHAYFTGLTGENATFENLRKIFKKSVLPLLQEYFFDDYYKIRLVLGDNGKAPEQQFVQEEMINYSSLFAGKPDEDRVLLPEIRYIINEKAFSDPESYIKIYAGFENTDE